MWIVKTVKIYSKNQQSCRQQIMRMLKDIKNEEIQQQ